MDIIAFVKQRFVIISTIILMFVSYGQAAYSFSGIVKNESGQGISGAKVTFVGTGVSTQTNATGNFDLSGFTQARTINSRISKKLFEINKNHVSIYSVEGKPTTLVLYDLTGRI
jgi:hypothetical protein